MDGRERLEYTVPAARGETSGAPLALLEQATGARLATTLARRPLVPPPPPPPRIATPAKQRDERAFRTRTSPRHVRSAGVNHAASLAALPAPAEAAQPGEGAAAAAAASVTAGDTAQSDSSDSESPGDHDDIRSPDPTRERLRALTRQVIALKAAHTKLLKRVRQLEHQVARHIMDDFS